MNKKSEIIEIKGLALPVPGNDIDTDRIIPARFMKCVTFDGLGSYAFYDERFDEYGKKKDHPLNDDKFKEGNILIANKNFGCGSSREHAPQALNRFGIDALIGESFAEIFAGNCLSMGIPAVVLKESEIQEILSVIYENPKMKVLINIENNLLYIGSAQYKFGIPRSSRSSLISGNWDTTDSLLKNLQEIKETAQKLPYIQNYLN